MAPSKPKNKSSTAGKRETKHGKNGKKGASGSSYFTWFIVIALLGVWTSVAVVWLDLVDYEEVLAKAKDFRYNLSEVLQGKLGVYDADGDGDFDVEDAKVLLGLKKREVVVPTSEDPDDDSPAPSESDLSDLDLEEAVSDEQQAVPPNDDFGDTEDTSDEHETHTYIDDVLADFNLGDAVEEEHKSEHDTYHEHEDDEPEIEEQMYEVNVPEVEQEPAADEDDDDDDKGDDLPEPVTEEQEPETPHEPEVEDLLEKLENVVSETFHINEQKEPAAADEVETEEEEEHVEERTETVIDEEPQADEEEAESEEHHLHSDLGTEGRDHDEHELPQHDHAESEPAEEEILADTQAAPEPEEEPVPEETEESAPEPETTDEEAITDSHEDNEPGDPQDDHVEVEQSEATENPVDDDRPNDRVEEHNTVKTEEQRAHHAGDEALSQEKKEKAKKKKPKLLNKIDKTIKSEIDAAEKLRKKGKVEEALKAFEVLVTKYPESPRARYGKAQSEDDLAEKMRSNEILLRAINTYEEVSALHNVATDLAKLALKRRANRQQFLGRMRGSLLTLQKLVQLYPEDISLKNDLGVGYLLIGDNVKAKEVYEEVLSLDPTNGFAKVHLGFILKADNKIAESIPYLKEGLLSGDPGTDDGRFYFHLGDALQRVGSPEAYTWYEAGHKKGHFASVWQRSLYNVNGLKAQPWWTAKETGYTDLVRTLEANWRVIRDEGLAVMDAAKGLFIPEDENLREKGDWSQYTLWQQGRKNEQSCKAAPRTCALLERFPDSTGCRRGQIKYSVMHPGTHVWPHTGPTNCRLRMHLGLVIPSHGCKIRCANHTRTWEEGKVIIFDDSFEHEVWQEADAYRLIFIVDVWHPELTQHQRRTLPAI